MGTAPRLCVTCQRIIDYVPQRGRPPKYCSKACRAEDYRNAAALLLWVSPKVREWGFHTKDGWVPWQEYVG